jgi:predicted Fe-S protein YdhL (DUF1289 family)
VTCKHLLVLNGLAPPVLSRWGYDLSASEYFVFDMACLQIGRRQCDRFPVTENTLHITDIEAAINYWRSRSPSPDGIVLSPEVAALAEVYALMAYFHETEVSTAGFPSTAMAAWLAWYDTTPDTPCIAICSTSQGDAKCKGCGRSFDEVQYWTAMDPVAKRAVWRRITAEGDSWRFNRYAERAAERLGTTF